MSDETAPAPGFSPLTANPAQLAANGFPPRPTGNAIALRAWTRAMERSKTPVVSAPIMSIGTGCNDYAGPTMRMSS